MGEPVRGPGARIDDEVDRRWFAPDLAGPADDADSVPPLPERGPPRGLDESAWTQLRETLRVYEREIAASVDPRRRAALCFEVGRIHETRLGDDRRAAAAYQRAFRCDPTHGPTLQAARGLFERAGRRDVVLSLLDAELRAGGPPARRARLLVAKGELYARLGDATAAQACHAAALELAPAWRPALRAMARSARAAGDLEAEVDALGRLAAATAVPRARALTLIEAASRLLGARPDDPRGPALLAAARAACPSGEEIDVEGALHAAGGPKSALMAAVAAAEGEAAADIRAARLAQVAADALRAGDPDRGRRLVEAALAADPSCAPALALAAELHLADGAWAAAAGAFEQLGADPARPVGERIAALEQAAALRLGRLGDEDAAVAALECLLAVDPTWPSALEHLGRLLSRRGEWARLGRIHEAELPRVADARQRANKLFKLGELRERRLRDTAGAARAYRAALSLTPGFRYAFEALARVLRARGEWPACAALLGEEAERTTDPADRAALWARLAALQDGRLGLPDAAVDTWRRVLALRPDDAEARRNLEDLLERTGRWDELVDALEGDADRAADARTRLACLVRAAEVAEQGCGDLGRARALLTCALGHDSRYLPALRALGAIHQRAGAWRELIEMYARELEVAESPPDIVHLHFKIGLVHRDMLRDAGAARAAFERVLEYAPEHRPALHALRSMYGEVGDLARVAELLEAEIHAASDPEERAALLERLAELHMRAGQPEQASEVWERLLAGGADAAAAQRALAALSTLHATRGDPLETAALLRRLAEAETSPLAASRIWMRVARLCADRLGLEAEAVDAAERAAALRPDDPAPLRLLERLYDPDGAPRELAAALGRLAALPSEAEARPERLVRRAALLDEVLADPEGAEADLRAALAEDPGRPEALAHLEALCARRGDRVALAEVLRSRMEHADDPRQRRLLLYRCGELAAEVGRFAEAARCFEAVLAEEPGNLPVVRALRDCSVALGRDEGVLRMMEAEGRLTADPAAAASLLLEAGRGSAERPGGEEAALRCLREALARAPEDEAAAAALRRLCEARGRWSELAEALARRFEAAPRPALALELAHLHASRLDQPAAAVRVLNQALARMPEAAPALLQRLGDLYADQEDWAEAVAVYERLHGASGDAELRRAVALRLAAIHEEKQPDLGRARAWLEDVLADAPSHLEATLRLARVAEALGDKAAARAAADRVLSGIAPGTPCGLLFRLAELALGQDRPRVAAQAYARALPDPEAALRLCALLREAPLPVEDVEAYAAALEQASRRLGGPEARSLRRALAALALTRGEAVTAQGALERLLEEDPDDPVTRDALAGALAARPETRDRAVTELRRSLAGDPFDVPRLRALVRVASQAGATDAASQAALWLSWLGAAEPAEQALIQAWVERAARWPARPVDASARVRLRSAREVPLLDEVLAAVAAVLPRAFGPRSARGAGAPDATLAERARRVADRLAAEDLRVRVDENGGDDVRALDTRPVTVVFGADFAARGPGGEQVFHLARGLELGRRGLAAVVGRPAAEVRALLEALAALDGHSLEGAITPPPELARRVSHLSTRLDARARLRLADHLPVLRRLLPALDLGSALAGIRESADRVALLLSGVLPAANVLRRESGGRNDTLAALGAWIVSAEHVEARVRLGLSGPQG